MLLTTVVIALTLGMTNYISAQKQDTVIFDALTGNFNIRYTGVVTYARDSAGNLRLLKANDVARDDEEIVERDSTFSAIFEPGTKIDITLDCTPSKVASEGVFDYAYELQNSPKSKQNLGVFILEFGEGLQVTGKTSNSWYGGLDYKQGGGKVANQWSWFPVGKNSNALAPGDSLKGFLIECRSLPVLGNAYVQGQTRKLPWPAHFKDTSFRNRLSRLWIFPANYICLHTVVPSAPPDIVQVAAFLDTLISYKHQALALKWIDNVGIANSLDQKLENARQQLGKRDSVAARNTLQAFVNEVEAQNDKHITSEAYALLKFNAEYLIDRLPQRGKSDKK